MQAFDPNQALRRAEAAYRNRQYAAAQSELATLDRHAPDHAQIAHLRALTERALGNSDAALHWFARAMQTDPADFRIANDRANLHRALGQHDLALVHYRRAATLRPGFIDARLGVAQTLIDTGDLAAARHELEAVQSLAAELPRYWNVCGRLERGDGNPRAAADAYDRAIALDPANSLARHGRAQVALELGDDDAVDRFTVLHDANPRHPEIALGLAEAREAASMPFAETPLAAALEATPDWVKGQAILARMRHEAGEPDFARSLRAATDRFPGNQDLWLAHARALEGADAPDRAMQILAEARQHCGDTPDLVLAEARCAGLSGDFERAGARLDQLPDGFPGARMERVRHAIRLGDADAAAVLLDRERAERPADVSAWALTDVVWRMVGDDRRSWLHEQPGLVSLGQLPLDAFELAAISDYLRSLHSTSRHPIGQSLRGGTQTRGRLLDRRHPLAERLRAAIVDAVGDHWAGLPAYDAGHPLLAHRDGGFGLAGSWSVRLNGLGFHVSHVHPLGVLSSASYFVLPDTRADADPLAGQLELGRPPSDLCVDLPPIRVVAPKIGHLALFPSTLHHGTRAFQAGERITAAFDVVPA